MSKPTVTKERSFIEKSSGNVFVDLGIPQADALLAKSQLVQCIANAITLRGLKQTEAAKLLGVDQAKVSALLRGNLTGFSTDRLLRFLNVLNHDIEIRVRRKPTERGIARTRVITA